MKNRRENPHEKYDTFAKGASVYRRIPWPLSGAAMAQALIEMAAALLVIATPGTSERGSFCLRPTAGAHACKKKTARPFGLYPKTANPHALQASDRRRGCRIASVSASEMRCRAEGSALCLGQNNAANASLWHHNDYALGFVVAGDSDLQNLEDIGKGGVCAFHIPAGFSRPRLWPRSPKLAPRLFSA